MILKTAVELSPAPEMGVGGIAEIERISPGQIRVSYYQTFKGPDGQPERRIILHIVWDAVVWGSLHQTVMDARAALGIAALPPAPKCRLSDMPIDTVAH